MKLAPAGWAAGPRSHVVQGWPMQSLPTKVSRTTKAQGCCRPAASQLLACLPATPARQPSSLGPDLEQTGPTGPSAILHVHLLP